MAAPVPVRVAAMPVSAAVPVFERVTARAEGVDPIVVLGKAKGDGLRLAAGALAVVPVPLTVILKDCAGPPPLLVAARPIELLLYAVVVVGENVTLSWQLAPGAIDVLHVPTEKLNGPVPEMTPRLAL